MSRILLVSNRLPVTVKLEHGSLRVARSPGGLATGLSGPHQRSKGLWLGWPGDVSRLSPEQRVELERRLHELRLVPLYLSPGEHSRFYEGFSNGVLWPLFHYLLDRVRLDSRDWESYQAVNARFAELVAAHYRPGDLIWVQDYQLCLLPAMLRERLPGARIGFFLHIPFPSSEVFRTLPWRTALLEGLLGADLIGFHTFSYARHFSSSLLRLLGLESEADRFPHEGREVRVGVFPMGVDAKALGALAESPEVLAEAELIQKDAHGRKIFLGIDRLDYTKGMPRRLLAFERLLEREPQLRSRVRLVQVAVPSRTKIEAYEALRREVDELVGRINGAYGSTSAMPIHYLYRDFNERHIAAFYRAADVMLVTPLRDGMNLVAKEFAAARPDEDGVLILSELAGAASELGGALRVNPYDIDQLAAAMKQALTMPAEERWTRMRALRQRVLQADVHQWAQAFLDDLAGDAPASGIEPGPETAWRTRLIRAFREAPRRVIFLDYDGTLLPFAPAPELAAPDPELRELLRALASLPETRVHIVSGRGRDLLGYWLSELPLGLHAEHGFWSRPTVASPWRPSRELKEGWKERLLPILEEFTARTPGSLIEEKSASVTWHYRMADPEFGSFQAKELRLHLSEVFSNFPVQVLPGVKAVEIRLQGLHKGKIVSPALADAPPGCAVLAMGDDRTDEDLFAALPPGGFAIHIGPTSSRATYRLKDPAAARGLLRELLAALSAQTLEHSLELS